MTIGFLRPGVFGMAGIVDLVEPAVDPELEFGGLASAFTRTPNTVTTVWRGAHLRALAYQHRDTALTPAGSYEYPVPQVGSCQGIVQGQFFSGFETLDQDQPRLWSISHTVVSGYAQEGPQSLDALNGAWVAALYDREQQCAIFVRDQVGVETLYVAPLGARVLFATDLRAFGAAGMSAGFDEQALLQFLHFLYIPNPRSAYEGIHAVLPGHMLIVERQGMHQERFARPRFVQGISLGGDSKAQPAIEEQLPAFEGRLMAAVESALPRQGRVALLMSAGKDSSALAIALKEAAPDRVVALTVGSSDSRYDESDYASRLCRHLGISHEVYTPDGVDLVPGFLAMVSGQDQPIGDPASLPLSMSFGRLPEDVAVVLDGTGNDYYFGIVVQSGIYKYQRRFDLQQRLSPFAWRTLLGLMDLGPARVRSTARDWKAPIEECFVAWHGWSQAELASLRQAKVDWSDSVLWNTMRQRASDGWIALQTEVICAIWEPHAAIRKTAHLARQSGRVVCYPFMDDRLAQFVSDLPQELKFSGNTNKILLRAYLAKHLPASLVNRPKGSFVFDQNLLLQSRAGFLPSTLQERGLLQVLPSWSSAWISEMLARYRRDPGGSVDKMYALALLSAWAATARGHGVS